MKELSRSIRSSSPSIMWTSRRRKVWNWSYHSRSQWVWGTTAMRRGGGAAVAGVATASP